MDYFCRLRYLPSKDNIVKIGLCDLDILFESKKLKILISLKQ